ncbi:regulator of G-protein signaling 9 [Trichinella spiralis]|uniref:Regulator of G-protein signaling 7 n=1 Tax=Trichinella spiralis TaxID=6334 RepID=E5SLI6_TRISP|nr:regulator of G-protein signaling 9 [Trichinella spiralis]KRY29910.1 Regulator of G-protein signaling 7 [Trichinella spiralis]
MILDGSFLLNKTNSLNAWQSWTYKRCFSLVLHLEQLHQLITEIQLLAIMSSFPMFRKMDELCIQMMKPDSGLPIKGQKISIFAASEKLVESSLLINMASCVQRRGMFNYVSGSELIEWLMTNLEEVDQAEALHLANQLSAFGYLFSVFDASAPVKEDNCLYRLQIPYFWPSSNMQPDSIEYAIFLSKRLLRNEEKHGLVEYEAESYQKLRELLGHMWDFVQSQAEMQLKLFKEKKKSEKVVFDSQEKAYWRIHRPPVEVRFSLLACCLLLCVQIERLKQILKTKPWLKSPKSLETLVSWCDQFSNYDPMLTPPRDPGNPWIVDDPTLWQLNANNVEVPTERRVRRWGFSIHELIKDPIGRQVLETFLESEFSQENIRFWLAVQDLKYSPSSEVNAKVAAIYNEFLVAGAPCQVNVDSQTLETVTKALKDQTVPLRYCFSQAEEHIFILMSKDSYPRFARSEIYRSMLAAAQQQGSKKLGWRSFLFGGNHGPLKKSQTSRTSPQGFYKNRDEGSTARLQNVVDMTKKSTLEPGDAISGTQPKNSPTFTCDGADSLDVEVPLK